MNNAKNELFEEVLNNTLDEISMMVFSSWYPSRIPIATFSQPPVKSTVKKGVYHGIIKFPIIKSSNVEQLHDELELVAKDCMGTFNSFFPCRIENKIMLDDKRRNIILDVTVEF